MSENILEIRDLVVEYHTDDADIYALNGINLDVKKGETIGLVCETGAGKTTIAKAILRILQTPPAKTMFFSPLRSLARRGIPESRSILRILE